MTTSCAQSERKAIGGTHNTVQLILNMVPPSRQDQVPAKGKPNFSISASSQERTATGAFNTNESLRTHTIVKASFHNSNFPPQEEPRRFTFKF